MSEVLAHPPAEAAALSGVVVAWLLGLGVLIACAAAFLNSLKRGR